MYLVQSNVGVTMLATVAPDLQKSGKAVEHKTLKDRD